MPRLPIDYSKTIIYKIVCDDLPDYVYIGSTADFRRRKSKHKSDCNNEISKHHNCKLYQTIRENGGFENWKMIEVERFTECKDGNDARKREQYFIDEFKSNLNMRKSIITEEQKKEYDKKYYEDNKEQILEQQKQYYEQNKDQILEQQKQYDKTHKEQKKEYDKKYKKQYREQNKEKIKEYNKQYRESKHLDK